MAKERLPQFNDGARAIARSAVRLKRSAALAAYDRAGLAKQRQAIERSHELLSSLSNPREFGGLVIAPAMSARAVKNAKPKRAKQPRKR